jgi:hypothetical protein
MPAPPGAGTLSPVRLEVAEVAGPQDRDRLELAEDKQILISRHDAVCDCRHGSPQYDVIVRVAADTLAKKGISGPWLELDVDNHPDAVAELARRYAELTHAAKGKPK